MTDRSRVASDEVPTSTDGGCTDGRSVFALSLVLGAIAAALYLPGLDSVPEPYWDEGHYLTDAIRFFVPSPGLTNPEHPPLGKWLIGLGIVVFGENPIGFRAASACASIVGIALLPLLLWRGGLMPARRSPLFFGLPSLLLLLDPLLYVTARIATLDAVLGLFYTASALSLCAALRTERVSDRLLAGVLGGLAMGVKWTGLTLIPVFFAAFVTWDGREFGVRWRRFAQVGVPFVGAYLACFGLPGALRFEPGAFHISQGDLDVGSGFLARVVMLHVKGVGYHTSYYASRWASAWYEWLVGRGPIWATVRADPNGVRVVAMIAGVPLVLAGGSAVLLSLVTAVRTRRRNWLILLAFPFAQLVLWAVVPRMTFSYYMSSVVPFYALALTVAAAELSARRRRAVAAAVTFVLALSAAWFVYVFPLVRGHVVAEDELRRRAAGATAPWLFHEAFPVGTLLELGRSGALHGAPNRARPTPASLNGAARSTEPSAHRSSQ